jgi:hypothetical protein
VTYHGDTTKCTHFCIQKQVNSKAIPVTGSGSLLGCEVLIPHYLDNRLTDDDWVVSLTCLPSSTPTKPQGLVRLEELGKLKKCNYLIGFRTYDLPACSIVPQPTRALEKSRLNAMFIGQYRIPLSTCFMRKVEGTLTEITLNFMKRQKQGLQASLYSLLHCSLHWSPAATMGSYSFSSRSTSRNNRNSQ